MNRKIFECNGNVLIVMLYRNNSDLNYAQIRYKTNLNLGTLVYISILKSPSPPQKKKSNISISLYSISISLSRNVDRKGRDLLLR